MLLLLFFFFNDTATTEIYTLSLHDALPISMRTSPSSAFALSTSFISSGSGSWWSVPYIARTGSSPNQGRTASTSVRSEEHTSELQSRQYLVCRLLLEKKKKRERTNSVTLIR